MPSRHSQLLQGLAFAADLLQDERLLELLEVRRMLEPLATALAVRHMTEEHLARPRQRLDDTRAAEHDLERLVRADARFHATVVAAIGNQALSSILDGISARTLRTRIWRGIIDADAAHDTLAEHQAIYDALAAGDAPLAQATALLPVSTSLSWLSTIQREAEAAPAAAAPA